MTIILILLLWIGQLHKDNSPACMCDPDALKQAVLDRIFESGIGSALYHSGDKPTFETLKQDQVLINKIWTYSKTLTDHCLKDMYVYWASSYQNEHDDSLNKLKHPEIVKEDPSVEEEKKKKREIAECKRRGIVPRITSGELSK